MSEEVANSYDEIPYQSVALMETHPERLASVATLLRHGARARRCRAASWNWAARGRGT